MICKCRKQTAYEFLPFDDTLSLKAQI